MIARDSRELANKRSAPTTPLYNSRFVGTTASTSLTRYRLDLKSRSFLLTHSCTSLLPPPPPRLHVSRKAYEGDGGPASKAGLDLPNAIAFAPGKTPSKMAIADFGHSAVRVITPCA